MSQQRAKVGGEVGVNGEFYEGGKFLPSTEKAKGKPAKRKVRRVQIERGVWVEAVEPVQTPIFVMVGGQAEYIDRSNPAAGIRPSVAGCRYYGETFCGYPVAELCEKFNAGKRWVGE